MTQQLEKSWGGEDVNMQKPKVVHVSLADPLKDARVADAASLETNLDLVMVMVGAVIYIK